MKFLTKLLIGLFVALILVISFYFFSLKQIDYDFVIVMDKEMIPETSCNEIGDQVFVVVKTGCPGCAKALPVLQEIEEEEGLEFKYINTAIEEERNELLNKGFITRFVPSVIINCKVYSGALSKEEYLELLK